MPTTNSSPDHAPPWLYGVVNLPFGIASGFAQFAAPFLFGRIGMPMSEQNDYAAFFLLPAAWQFLWAPVIDVGPRRKHWLILMAALGAICLFGAVCTPIDTHRALFVRLTVAAQVFTGLCGACIGGLMATTLPDELRGRAGGWFNAGNLGGAALGGGVVMWCFGHEVSPTLIGAMIAAMTVLPALGALLIHEPARPAARIGEVFRAMLKSVGTTLFSRAGITGILVCASPVGTAALLNVLSGMGPEYRASEGVVTFVTGFMGGLVTALGSLIGGFVCDRIPRRVAYLLAGGLTATCGLVMSFFPLTQQTYVVGATTYLLITGFCYAAFSAMVLEIIGKAGPTAGTQYTLFTAAANQAISYTNLIDGWGARRWGTRGMLRTDAAANFAGIAFLSVVMAVIARLARPRRQAQRTE